MRANKIIKSLTVSVTAIWLLGACTSSAPLATVDYVDLQRFSGDWYVIASIPTRLEADAYNAVESYAVDEDGTIDTQFSFREGAFDGVLKEYSPRGFIRNENTNAEWGMQFIWPIKADYRVVYLDETYSTTVIGRNKRDYVWIMSRHAKIGDRQYQKLESLIASLGYDVTKLRKVPQQW